MQTEGTDRMGNMQTKNMQTCEKSCTIRLDTQCHGSMKGKSNIQYAGS